MQTENSDLSRQVEDMESQLSGLHRLKSQLISQLEEAKRTADDETRSVEFAIGENPRLI
jgi:cell division septum initiation protein DivIVA